MQTILFLLMLVTGFTLTWSVLLMSPKGGIGFWIWGISSTNEYGSQKSIESTLKTVATISAIILIVCSLFWPYIK